MIWNRRDVSRAPPFFAILFGGGTWCSGNSGAIIVFRHQLRENDKASRPGLSITFRLLCQWWDFVRISFFGSLDDHILGNLSMGSGRPSGKRDVWRTLSGEQPADPDDDRSTRKSDYGNATRNYTRCSPWGGSGGCHPSKYGDMHHPKRRNGVSTNRLFRSVRLNNDAALQK